MLNHNPKETGFTLLEVLIALAIFALLATMTAQALRQSFINQAHLKQQAEQMRDMQLVLARLTRDLVQATNRPIRGESLRLFPAFIGQPGYIEFTRGGTSSNPLMDKQHHLSRVGYRCKGGQLIRRTFLQLDPISRDQFEEETLLSHLKKCRFVFLNKTLQDLPAWRGGSTEPLPKAVQVTLTTKEWGELMSLFNIPEAMYADLSKTT